MGSDHQVKADSYSVDFPAGTVTLIDFKLSIDTSGVRSQVWRYERIFRAIERERKRAMRSAPPAWLDEDPPLFAFPGWGPAWRPFDCAVDS